MKFAAAMFDLDGTLLDTLEDIADSVNLVLAGHGYPEHPLDAYRYFVGDGMSTLTRRVLPESERNEAKVAATMAEVREVYGSRWDVKSTSYGGVPEMLAELADRGLKRCVLSNKPDGFTKLCVEKMLEGARFEIVRGARDGVPKKPDPTAAIDMAKEMDVAPERFLYLGDTNTDMRTANGAGMYAVGAAWGFRDAEELEQSGADAVIHHPSELIDLL